MTQTLRRAALAGFITILLADAALGSNFPPAAARWRRLSPARQTQGARKIDEFGPQYGCGGGAHMDNFAIELEKEPDSTAYIIAYDALDRAPGTAKAYGETLRRYLFELRGLEESRTRLVYAGRHEGDALKIELWLVPQGAEPPPTSPVKDKKGEQPFGGKFAEYSAFDDTQFYDTDGGEAGDYSLGVTYAAFDDVLKRQKESQGYIVVYAKPGSAPGYWRRIGTREQQILVEQGVGPERLTIVNGGVNKPDNKSRKKVEGEADEETYGKVELWIGGKDKPPVKEAKEKGAFTEAVKVGQLNFLSDEREKVWGLNNLSEMLRAGSQSTACIIIYPDDGSEPYLEEDGRTVPRPDPFKIAEGFKAELLKRGVEETRIVLMNGPQTAWHSGELELWAVPYGAAMPDLFAKSEEEEQPDEGKPEE